jgi:enamine deaminase RidA (YjgF/YER057c/UK114 family)
MRSPVLAGQQKIVAGDLNAGRPSCVLIPWSRFGSILLYSRARARSGNMTDASSSSDLQQFLSAVSRRRVMTGAVTLAIAGAIPPAGAQPIDRRSNMPDNVRFSNPDTMQKPPGYSHVVEVTGPGRTVYFAGQLGIDKSGKMGANAREQMERGCPAFLLNIEKRSLPRLMLSGDGLASNAAV